MSLTLSRTPRRAAVAVIAGLALAPLAGCGSDESAGGSSGGDPARLAPAAAPFFFEVTVRPSGDQRKNLDTVLGKIAPGKDVGRLLTDALTKSSKGKVTYQRDIEPWIGEKAGLAITSLPAGKGAAPDLAAIIDTKDADKATATLTKAFDGKPEKRTYNGVDYRFTAADKTAGGIVDGELVVGTERGFRAVVDASKGQSLAENATYTKARDAVADGALGFFYGDLRRVFDLASSSATGTASAQQLQAARGLLERQGPKTIAVALGVTESSITVRSATTGKDGGDAGATADLVAGLPQGAFAAFGLGDLGKQLTRLLSSVRSFSSTSGFDVDGGLKQLQEQAGIDVQKDLLDWMGQSALFASGSSITDLGGALVVKSKDPAATKAALAKAKTIAAGAGLKPRPVSGGGIDDGFSVAPAAAGAAVEVFAVQAGDRFVLAVNRAALDQAIKPTATLGDDDTFKTATKSLGDGLRPTFFLDFRKISGLIGLAAGSQPGYARVRPYLDAITTIVAGAKRDGDVQRQTLVVGVR